MQSPEISGQYSFPSADLAPVSAQMVQYSPLVPGASVLEDTVAGSLSEMSMLAPPGTVERQYTLALALRALVADGTLTVLAPKDKGGSRLRGDLEKFGCVVDEDARKHHRICTTKPVAANEAMKAALQAGAPCFVESIGLWSQPGLFSWNRVDAGTALLLAQLPPLQGRGADMGCGIGALAKAILESEAVNALALVDIDRRAMDAARKNVVDARATFHWADVGAGGLSLENLDFVVMNPPFHDGGQEDRALGMRFIEQAHIALRFGGSCWFVANRHLPYEEVLQDNFAQVSLKIQAEGYKVYEARK